MSSGGSNGSGGGSSVGHIGDVMGFYDHHVKHWPVTVELGWTHSLT